MARRQSIRNEGEGAEFRFLQFVSGARASESASAGDAVVDVEGLPSYVEVKQCDSKTINQVRPVKYIPCVVWLTSRDPAMWLVFSPDDLLRIAASKKRGQHTELAFECMNISVTNSLLDHPGLCVSDSQLDLAVRNAIRRGRAARLHMEATELLRRELRALAERFSKRILDLG